jgi:hypothetical protein
MAQDAGRQLERLRYWQGQRLRSRDFNDEATYTALLRAWHNRALHAAGYGIVEGLGIEFPSGGHEVEVRPGLAYDAAGRELLLARPVTMPLPQRISAGVLVLMLRFRPAETASNPAVAACLPGGTPGSLAVDLLWMPAAQFDGREGVGLARLLPTGRLDPEFAPARTRPLARPRIAYGATLAGATPWRPWERTLRARFPAPPDEGPTLLKVPRALNPAREPGEEGEGDLEEARAVGLRFEHFVHEARTARFSAETDAEKVARLATEKRLAAAQGLFRRFATVRPAESEARATVARSQLLGLEVDVDTSAAGFTRTPEYFVSLDGDFFEPLTGGKTGESSRARLAQINSALGRIVENTVLLQVTGLRFGHITRPTATGFTYRLWFPHLAKLLDAGALSNYLALLAQRGLVALSWVGVQDDDGASAGAATRTHGRLMV